MIYYSKTTNYRFNFHQFFVAALFLIISLQQINAIPIFPALPNETIQQRNHQIETDIQKRWSDVVKKKKSFAFYGQKTDEEIHQEYRELDKFRLHMWYRDPNASPHVCQQDYKVAQALLEKGLYHVISSIAFDYNCTDNTYNASTILMGDQHFIAMQEPNPNTQPLFFKLLINHHASILVRLKPEFEYTDENSIKYWEDRLTADKSQLNIEFTHSGNTFRSVSIPYFTVDTWRDNEDMDIPTFYNLVQNVRKAYQKLSNKGPIACHCASGVGRTGTFLAALVLADTIDRLGFKELSIEEIVLKLCTQRPNLLSKAKQYVMLYRFVDYYQQQMLVKQNE